MPTDRLARRLIAAAVLAAGSAAVCPAGEVFGRIVVEGELAEPKPVPPGRDACCQRAAPVDESVLVGEGGGLANVVVSVEPRRGDAPLPAAEAPLAEPPILTNKGCAFRPRVLIARVGEPLVLVNDDPTMHNVAIAMARNGPVNVVVAPEGRRQVPLGRVERRPIAVRCNVHTFMQGWLLVRDDPWAAVTDASGRFRLPPLPPGDWRLRFWWEGAPMADLEVVGDRTDERGEVLVRVSDDQPTDVGTIAVTAHRLR